MSSFGTISLDRLARLIGIPDSPTVIDVRSDEDLAADPRIVPAAIRRSHETVTAWAAEHAGRSVIVSCQRGAKLSQGCAAWLRSAGARAEVLDGGHVAWAAAGLPLVPISELPVRNAGRQTVWVTRARPKVDRIACPWLIRRFIDSSAVFLFVAPADVLAVAERFDAEPFDVENVRWSHRGELCTFDVMIADLGLATPALGRLAAIVRGADTARHDIAPEASGLLAASLGLSRMYADDLAQLDAGMVLYDAFYRWCRDATEETHNWPTNKSRS